MAACVKRWEFIEEQEGGDVKYQQISDFVLYAMRRNWTGGSRRAVLEGKKAKLNKQHIFFETIRKGNNFAPRVEIEPEMSAQDAITSHDFMMICAAPPTFSTSPRETKATHFREGMEKRRKLPERTFQVFAPRQHAATSAPFAGAPTDNKFSKSSTGKRPLEDAPMAAVPKQANPLVPQPTPMNSPARGVTSTSLILIDDDIPLCLQVGDTIMHDEGEEEDQVLYSAVDF